MTTKKFESLPASQKRVVLAKDILKYIKVKVITPNAGYYIDISKTKTPSDKQVQENFHKVKNCVVCEMGALLLAIVKYRNQATFSDLNNIRVNCHDPMWDKLKGIFSAQQMYEMECCFEGTSGWASARVGIRFGAINYDKRIYSLYLKKFPTDKTRMIAIMKNIIRNNGVFKPKQDIK